MYEARQRKEKVSRRIEVGCGAKQRIKIENSDIKNIIPFYAIQRQRNFNDKELKWHRSWAWKKISIDSQWEKIKKENVKEKLLDTSKTPDKLLYIKDLEDEYRKKCTSDDNMRLRILIYEWVMAKIYEDNVSLTAEELKNQQRLNPLPPKLNTHIFYGHFEDGKVTGYHSTYLGNESTNRIADNSEREELGNGIYKAKVVNRQDPTKEKKDKSTFFPDLWTQKDIIAAINMRNTNGYVYDEGQKWHGLKLCKNGDTIYPQFLNG